MNTQPAEHLIAFVLGFCILAFAWLFALIASSLGRVAILYIAGGVLAAYAVGWAVLWFLGP